MFILASLCACHSFRHVVGCVNHQLIYQYMVQTVELTGRCGVAHMFNPVDTSSTFERAEGLQTQMEHWRPQQDIRCEMGVRGLICNSAAPVGPRKQNVDPPALQKYPRILTKSLRITRCQIVSYAKLEVSCFSAQLKGVTSFCIGKDCWLLVFVCSLLKHLRSLLANCHSEGWL